MHPIDWAITAVMLLVIVSLAFAGRRFMKDVAGYLSAGRSAGRYMLSVSTSASMVGAISIIAFFERNMEAGFVLQWWEPIAIAVMVLAMIHGWVIYRFRQTRCLTLAEFFERRYSRRFRIFSGLVTFGSGMLNFGIFPSVGSRFFLYFCGLPDVVEIGGVRVNLFIAIMLVLLSVSLWIVLMGGQVCVMLTDFIQGAFTNITFVVITVFLLLTINWTQVTEVLTSSEPGFSKINPFDADKVQDFNLGFFAIGLIGWVYARMSWQGEQAYNASARTAHEAKMGAVLYVWNDVGKLLFTTIVPVLMFVVLSHPSWVGVQASVAQTMDSIDSSSVRSQMRTPVALRDVLPAGFRGMMAAMMLGAFISTHTTYMHSWSSIFIQDVVLPLRKNKARISQKQQLRLLRASTAGVAIFAALFSSFYVPSEAVQLYFAATGAIFAGWSGAVIIGGLYWRRGTARGAWVAALSGVSLVLVGLALQQAEAGWRDRGVAFFGLLDWMSIDRVNAAATWVHTRLPNGQQLWGWSMLLCTALYVLAAYPWSKRFDLDGLLHRNDGVEADTPARRVPLVERLFGVDEMFTRRDKLVYLGTILFNGAWLLITVAGSLYVGWHISANDGTARDLDPAWMTFWRVKIWVMVAVAAGVTAWFLVGGFRDAARMVRDLRAREISEDDTGIVRADTGSADET